MPEKCQKRTESVRSQRNYCLSLYNANTTTVEVQKGRYVVGIPGLLPKANPVPKAIGREGCKINLICVMMIIA
jgi:hypothetical protein